MANVFVYGTLMSTQVQRMVMRRAPQSVPAVLQDYKRYAVQRAHFPGIVEEPQAETRGLLLKDVSKEELASLDRYEGEGSLYERRQVQVETGDGFEEAYTYVFMHRASLEKHDWKVGA